MNSSGTGCQCPPNIQTAFLTPADPSLAIGALFDGITTTEETANSCTGVITDVDYDPTSWTVTSPSVMSIAPGAPSPVHALAAGSTAFNTFVVGIRYTFTSVVSQ